MDPSFAQLKARLTSLKPLVTAFSGIGYRACSFKYANERDLVTGEGSRRNGGRWNPPGIAVIYLSLSPETAMSESLAHHRYFGIPIEDAMPKVFVAIEAHLPSILDLRVGSTRQRVHLSEDRMVSVDWRQEGSAGHQPVTHSLGLAAFEVGLEGLIVPSSANPREHNLIVFPANLASGSMLSVKHSKDLPAT